MDINQVVIDAFDKTRQIPVEEQSELKRNRQRSINWVESLASEFRTKFPKEKDFRVFSKYFEGKNGEQRKEFGMNELLYDISVCKVNYLESPKHKTRLAYIEKAHWLVESELAKDTRGILYDFNKLIIGDAENKLFVGALSPVIEEFIPKLFEIAQNCIGIVYLCLIPHPKEWDKKLIKPKLWKFSGEYLEDGTLSKKDLLDFYMGEGVKEPYNCVEKDINNM